MPKQEIQKDSKFNKTIKYDVVIIGGGPGGLKCAETLGEDGTKKVLVVEKKDKIGPKTCGGGLTEWDKMFALPEDKIQTFERQYFDFEGEEYYAETPISTIDRVDLGQFQLKQVKKFKNIDIWTETTAKEINKDYILIKKDKETIKVEFDYLVGADGSTSIVRRYLNLPNRFFTGFRYIIPNQEYDKFTWIFDFKKLGSNYAWVFPFPGGINAGIYYNPEDTKHIKNTQEAKKLLNEILDEYKVDYKDQKIEGMQVNCLYKGHHFDNIYLIGDSAGLTSAPTGEGISFAMTSGKEVAEHILDKNHDFKALKEIMKYKNLQERFLWVTDTFPFLLLPTVNFVIKKYLKKS
jgi:geranylgeranyl reductase